MIASTQVLGSAASPPTVSLVTPNIGSAAGGWAVKITGTNLTGATAVTIAGVAATSVVVVNATTITCVAPAFSTPNGTSTGQTVSVTTPGGSASGSVTNAKYFYLPSNTAFLFCHRGDVGVTLGSFGVATWADISGSGNNWTQATGVAQPQTAANYNGSGVACVTTDGSAQFMSMTLAASVAGLSVTMFMVGTNLGTNLAGMLGFSTAASNALTIAPNAGNWIAWDVDVSSYNIVASDTNPHSFGLKIVSGGASSAAVDAHAASGTLATAAYNQAWLGATGNHGAHAAFSHLNVMMTLAYVGVLSAPDFATVMAIQKATGLTP